MPSQRLTSVTARYRPWLVGKDFGHVPALSISYPLSHPPWSLYPHTTSNYLHKPQKCCHGDMMPNRYSRNVKRAKRLSGRSHRLQTMTPASTSFARRQPCALGTIVRRPQSIRAGKVPELRHRPHAAEFTTSCTVQSNLHRSTPSTPCCKPVPVTRGHVPFRPVSHSDF